MSNEAFLSNDFFRDHGREVSEQGALVAGRAAAAPTARPTAQAARVGADGVATKEEEDEEDLAALRERLSKAGASAKELPSKPNAPVYLTRV